MATTSSKISSSDESLSGKSDDSPVKLTQEQKDRMEKNRKRALDIKIAKENAAKV